MSLLSQTESRSFNSFLTSVDRSHSVEFGVVTPDLADKITIKQGRDALAKATMDLMVKGDVAHGPKPGSHSGKSASPGLDGSGSSSHWPSFSPEAGSSTNRHRSGSRGSTKINGTPETSGSSSASPFTLPPLAEHLSGLVGESGDAQSAVSSSKSKTANNVSKRSFPPDNDGRSGATSMTKRSRPSLSGIDSTHKSRRQTSSTSASSTKIPSNKPALLSASQKRANHIQSEQKRRANIRRGYEALCIAVPELREAIALEDTTGGGDDVSGIGKGRKRRKKEESALDGRAGPKSENIVLSKTIDYIHSLISDRHVLLARLHSARGALAPGHPVLSVTRESMDENGVPLWEREWNGGIGIPEDGGDEEGGEEDVGDDNDGSDDDG